MHRATEMKVTLNHREGHNLDHSPQFGERLDIEAVLREDSPDYDGDGARSRFTPLDEEGNRLDYFLPCSSV
jgi:hypothetical protein